MLFLNCSAWPCLGPASAKNKSHLCSCHNKICVIQPTFQVKVRSGVENDVCRLKQCGSKEVRPPTFRVGQEGKAKNAFTAIFPCPPPQWKNVQRAEQRRITWEMLTKGSHFWLPDFHNFHKTLRCQTQCTIASKKVSGGMPTVRRNKQEIAANSQPLAAKKH